MCHEASAGRREGASYLNCKVNHPGRGQDGEQGETQRAEQSSRWPCRGNSAPEVTPAVDSVLDASRCPGRGLRGGELKASLPLPSAMRTSRLPLHREAMSALRRARAEPISVGTSDREVIDTRGRTVYTVYCNCVCSSRQKGFYL